MPDDLIKPSKAESLKAEGSKARPCWLSPPLPPLMDCSYIRAGGRHTDKNAQNKETGGLISSAKTSAVDATTLHRGNRRMPIHSCLIFSPSMKQWWRGKSDDPVDTPRAACKARSKPLARGVQALLLLAAILLRVKCPPRVARPSQ